MNRKHSPLSPLLNTVLVAIFASQGAQAASTAYAQARPLALRSARPSTSHVARYGTIEWTLDLAASYDNPFDPDQIDVHADLTPPQGKIIRVNGFLDQPFTRRLDGRNERLESAGPPVWRVRFTPNAAGVWHCRIGAQDKSGAVSLPATTFRVTPSSAPGFVRRSARNPAVFAFDNGTPFFAVGENMGWADSRGSFAYDDWLRPLGENGANWVRLWMSPWNCPLETFAGQPGTVGGSGLGVYDLANAWKLDTILDAAARNRVQVMVCLGTYGEFTTGGFFGEGMWPKNPYNAANRGPCRTPADFWTDATARKLYRHRLRYLTARYGARTDVQAWEFWNETDAPAPWVAEMAQYLKGTGPYQGRPADPYRHLITTTYGNDAVWKIPEVDFTQTHLYGTGDIPDFAPPIHADARHLAGAGKPHLMAEFGIDWRDSDAKYDPLGRAVNFHNGLWSGALSGDAGGAMLWWWDNYVAPEHLAPQFRGLSRFVQTVPWAAGPWRPLAFDAARTSSGPETFSDMTLPAATGWGKAAASDFTLRPEGVADLPALPSYLYSPGKADLRTTPTFHVRCARPSRFVVHLDTVSDAAHLRFLLDGQPALDVSLSATPPSDPAVKPAYESSKYRPEYKNYIAVFNKDYGIVVPPGAHTITLDCAAGDWASVTSYTLTGYKSSRYPEVNLYGLTRGRTALFWAQNGRHNWKSDHDGVPVPVIRGAATALRGLPPGRYRVDWWDTQRGVVTGHRTALSAGGRLTLTLPDLPADVAAQVKPLRP